MKALFFIANGEVKLFMDIKKETLTEVREDLMYQLNILANHERSNEYQPTMNHKDAFHFYVKMEDGTEEKRGFLISNYYKSEKRSLRMIIEASDRAKETGILR